MSRFNSKIDLVPRLFAMQKANRDRQYYGYLESEGVAPGLDMGLCLVADTAAVESMNGDLPWVYALDMRFDHSSEVEGGEYLGYFRVAVDSVIPELYPMLSVGMTPREMWFPGDKVWTSAI